MIHYRKTYEVTGYTADADIYCVDCAATLYGPNLDTAHDREGNEVHPVFLGDEFDFPQHCNVCHDPIDTCVINRPEETEETETE